MLRNSSSQSVSQVSTQYLVLAAFALFTFWENTVLTIRIFDFVGLAIILGIALLGRANLRLFDRAAVFIFLILNLTYVALGVIRGFDDSADLKAALGFGLGVLTFLLFRGVRVEPQRLLRLVNALMLAHSICVLLQFSFFYLGNGFILNLNPFVPTENLRVIEGAGFLRASGFFAEPASHGLTLTLLFSLKSRITRISKLDAIDWIGIVSMLISGSIWAIVAVLVWLAYPRLLRMSLAAIFVFIALNTSYMPQALYNNPVVNRILVERVELLRAGEDRSVEARYTSSAEYFDSIDAAFFFGNGVQSGKGVNAVVRYIHSHGLLGFLAFLILCFAMTPKVERFHFVFWILFLLTAAGSLPFFLIWWAWLAFYSNLPIPNRRQQLAVQSNASMNLSFAR